MQTESKLRHWQGQAIDQALSHYQRNSHFFVQATPASGKTRMTAELAKWMLNAKLIDLVICFAPSCEVVSSITSTYSSVIRQFKGNSIASVGAAFTYQSMDYLSDEFWRTLSDARTLVVFDEIHHCAGHHEELSNTWGQNILQHIQDRATYTLGLSGTPWRSDDLPIALAR